MQVFNIVGTETYQKDGEEKKAYNPIGKLLQFEKDGKTYYKVTLNHVPGVQFSVYSAINRKKSEPEY